MLQESSGKSDAARRQELVRNAPAAPAYLVSGCTTHLDSWAQAPSSAIYVALWSRRTREITEHCRPTLTGFHKVTVRLDCSKSERWHDGRKISGEELRSGAWSLVPDGVQPRVVFYGSFRGLQIYIPTGFLDGLAAELGVAPGAVKNLDRRLTYDRTIDYLGRLAVAEIEHGDVASPLQLDTIGTNLCVQLLRRAGEKRADPERLANGGLAPWQISRATRHISERLDETVTLARLAHEVGLSQYHFARAFKQSMGITPHRYLLRCRLERAKDLLANTDMLISDISATVGYAEPTQLSRLFRSELGTSPASYRRALG